MPVQPTTPSALSEAFQGLSITPEAAEFGRAMDRYQRRTGRRYPTWLEVLNVAKDLGWRKAQEQNSEH